MFGSVVLDVAIGMAFVYLLLSLIASVIQEGIATYLQLRPANLLIGIRSLFSGDLFQGKDLVDLIYNHGLIRSLYSDPERDDSPGMSRLLMDKEGADYEHRQAQAAVSRVQNQTDQAADNNKEAFQGMLTGAQADLEAAIARSASAVQAFDKAAAERTVLREKLSTTKGDSVRNFLKRALYGLKPVPPVANVSNQKLLPAYIPARGFALALIDTLNTAKSDGEEVMTSVTAMLGEQTVIYPSNKALQALYALAVDSRNDVEAFQRHLEDWYNDSMDRVSGWYKRHVQTFLFATGLLLAVLFNVDSVRVARTLWFDRDTRQAMLGAAGSYLDQHKTPVTAANPEKDQATDQGRAGQGDGASANAAPPATLRDQLNQSVSAFDEVTKAALLPVGWRRAPDFYLEKAWTGLRYGDSRQKLQTVWWSLELALGWLITGLAISLGAPFWFDLLNKFMIVRSTVKPQEKSQTEGSKDKSDEGVAKG